MMKSKFILVAIAFCVISFIACNSATQKTEAKEETKQDSTMIAPQPGDKVIYQCPMHPEEISDKPGQCPKCGMDLEKAIVRGKDTIRS
jgi:Cu+-exporting ATPase